MEKIIRLHNDVVIKEALTKLPPFNLYDREKIVIQILQKENWDITPLEERGVGEFIGVYNVTFQKKARKGEIVGWEFISIEAR